MTDPVPQIDPAVLDAARRTIRAHGWNGTTAERIAAEAGISRVTLHRRGINREDILAALTEVAIDAYRAAMWPALVAAGTGAERLVQALEALCAVAEDHLEILVALQAASDAIFHELDEDTEEIETRSPFTEPLQKLLGDGAADGTIRVGENPGDTATVLFNATGWTYIHLRTGHGWVPDKARSATLDLILRGLLPAE